uniref:putative methyltransferase DDB_G0268948 isoform X1 n=1 Tax=Styela clava TaxID=7725 RepID=UPI0019398511|nr:putative methyltransferase DDB_G0268948 isoform X1 [Styela clava]XP_039261528.1 putative methyltransferase DDB_G0268948 isoform X1 [Styela clava]
MSSTKIYRYYEGSRLANFYLVSRPTYPTEILKSVLKFLGKEIELDCKPRKMIDVGCGSGQNTHMYSHHFESILGIDISEAQIVLANKINTSENVCFQLVDDNLLPVEDSTIDLVTCACSAHWLDMEIFERECERVLKPGGCCAIYTYVPIKATKVTQSNEGYIKSISLIEVHRDYLSNVNAHHRTTVAFDFYVEIFKQLKNNTKEWNNGIESNAIYTMSEYKDFFASMGEYHIGNYTSCNDPLDVLAKKVKKLLDVENTADEELSFILTYVYPTIVFRKTQKDETIHGLKTV